MRTTVELPPELLRAAKSRSAESGESLKNLLVRAVSAELHLHTGRRGPARRVTLPLFGDSAKTLAQPSNEDLERALADADAVARPVKAQRSPGSRRPRRET